MHALHLKHTQSPSIKHAHIKRTSGGPPKLVHFWINCILYVRKTRRWEMCHLPSGQANETRLRLLVQIDRILTFACHGASSTIFFSFLVRCLVMRIHNEKHARFERGREWKEWMGELNVYNTKQHGSITSQYILWLLLGIVVVYLKLSSIFFCFVCRGMSQLEFYICQLVLPYSL